MSAVEKTEMRDSLMHFMAAHPLPRKITHNIFSKATLVVSPYSGISMRMTKVLVFSFIGMIFAGGGLTIASANSIPGELLYPIKINIKETIEGSLKTAPAEKLAWKEQKVTRRIEEIKTLQSKKQVTKREAVIAQAVLKKHVEELNQTVSELKDENQDAILATTAQLIPKTETLINDSSVTTTPETTIMAKGVEPTVETATMATMSLPETTTDGPIDPTTAADTTVEVSFEAISETDTEGIKDALIQEVMNQIQKIKENVESTTKEGTSTSSETSVETSTTSNETSSSATSSVNTATVIAPVVDLTVIPLEIEKKEEPKEEVKAQPTVEVKTEAKISNPISSVKAKVKTSINR